MMAIVVFIVLACVFGLSYYFNMKTPVPEGCEEERKSCKGCAIANCTNRIREEKQL